MNTRELQARLKAYEKLLQLNNLVVTEKDGSSYKLVTLSENNIESIADTVSSTEYIHLGSFLKKISAGIPLLRKGSENKEELEEEDFVYYE